MKKIVDNILKTWHKHFEDEENHYSEFESSDIEYFVACMLYNQFKFSKALATLKTIDLSYDFLSSCGDEYDSIKADVDALDYSDEMKSLEFLINFLQESQAKYSADELYLLNRIDKQVQELADRYEFNIQPQRVEFVKPPTRSPNPLLR